MAKIFEKIFLFSLIGFVGYWLFTLLKNTITNGTSDGTSATYGNLTVAGDTNSGAQLGANVGNNVGGAIGAGTLGFVGGLAKPFEDAWNSNFDGQPAPSGGFADQASFQAAIDSIDHVVDNPDGSQTFFDAAGNILN